MTLVKDSVSATRTRSAVTARTGRSGRRRENLAGYLFMSPWIAGFLLLTAGPMVASLYFAFTDYNLFNSPKWVGFDNFTTMFDDPRWQKSVEVTAKYVVIGTPLKLLLALGVALLLAQSRRGQAFYRAAFYAPSLIGASVSVGFVWRSLFSDGAVVDRMQSFLGFHVGGWVGNADWVLYCLVALTVWQFGAPMVIFLAGLKQVPKELLRGGRDGRRRTVPEVLEHHPADDLPGAVLQRAAGDHPLLPDLRLGLRRLQHLLRTGRRHARPHLLPLPAGLQELPDGIRLRHGLDAAARRCPGDGRPLLVPEEWVHYEEGAR